jgi:hypothetical protein
MRDNKPLELEALAFVTYKIAKYGYKYTHPNFDKDGADFFIQEKVAEDLHKVISCQSKGRDITDNNSNVKIHTKYLKDSFLLFLYLKDDIYENEDNLFLFTKEDVQLWEIKDGNYYLNIPQNSLDNAIFVSYKFDKNNSRKIANILANIDVGLKIETKVLTNLETLSNLLVLWDNTGSLPDANLTRKLLEDFDSYLYINLEQFIFLLCIVIHNEENLGFQYSIDWGFQYLKYYNEIEPNNGIWEFKTQKTTYPSSLITYNKTSLAYLEKGSQKGFKLQFGDIEEYFDCYLFQNGEYFLTYAQTGKTL